MEKRGCNGNGGGGVKVTFIETQFVTSDAAGFKSLVQRLTGIDAVVSSPPAAAPIQRPRPCRAAAAVDGRRGDGEGRAAVTPAASANWVEMMMLLETCDFAEILCGVDGGASGGYGGFIC
uniref:VQ domain-containing protein n=1 Tax=Leersia perrieri TaxID=77586 RepID=A0A0D9VEC3_9ORYZ